MKNIILLLMSVIWMAGCSQSTNNPHEVNPNYDLGVDISKLQLVGDLTVDTVESIVEFGTANPAADSLTKTINLKNSSTAPVPFVIDSLSANSGFLIKTNRCLSPLAVKGSCAITVTFSSRGLFTGPVFDYLVLNSGSNQLPIKLSASIEGQNDPNTMQPTLVYTLTTTSNGKVLNVKNTGPGNASNISVTPPTGYVVSISRCGAPLKANQSCNVTLVFSNYRNTPQPTQGAISINAKGNNTQLPPTDLNVSTGQVIPLTEPVTDWCDNSLLTGPMHNVTIMRPNLDQSGLCTSDATGNRDCAWSDEGAITVQIPHGGCLNVSAYSNTLVDYWTRSDISGNVSSRSNFIKISNVTNDLTLSATFTSISALTGPTHKLKIVPSVNSHDTFWLNGPPGSSDIVFHGGDAPIEVSVYKNQYYEIQYLPASNNAGWGRSDKVGKFFAGKRYVILPHITDDIILTANPVVAVPPVAPNAVRVALPEFGIVKVRAYNYINNQILVTEHVLTHSEDFDFNQLASDFEISPSDVRVGLVWNANGSGKTFLGWYSGPTSLYPNVMLSGSSSSSTAIGDRSMFDEWIAKTNP